MNSLRLTGLDAQNPLAYFAALGLLRVIDSHAVETRTERPRLSFIEEGRFLPLLWTPLTMEDAIAVVLNDAERQADNMALQFAFDADGAWVPANTAGATRDLKPSPTAARELLDRAATAGPRVSRLAAAWFSELVQAGNGKTKPTAFHFTSATQYFLHMIEELRRNLTAEQLHETLIGPWLNTSTLPSLTWDSSVARLYALRASNPSGEKRGTVPAANWLGALGLEFFPVVPEGKYLATTGVTGTWKQSVFQWPVWEPPASASTVASLLRLKPTRWTGTERAAMGISAVFASTISRADQGGAGSFSPAEVVLAREGRGDARKSSTP